MGEPRSGAVRAFRSAVRGWSGAGEASFADAAAPTVDLCAWRAAPVTPQKMWLEAPDAEDVRFELRVNGGAPMSMRLGPAPVGADVWELSCEDAALRAPAEPGAEIALRIEASARGGRLRQTLADGAFDAPAQLASVGAPGALVPLDVGADGIVRSHLFVHVLNIEGRGRTAVALTAWLRL